MFESRMIVERERGQRESGQTWVIFRVIVFSYERLAAGNGSDVS